MPVNIPGIENLSPAVKYVIAFAIIFILLALFALILRRLTGGRMSVSSDRGRARQPRLGIVDVYDLDRQRQLILLRRDNVEHLLLVGGPNDVVVETNIVRVAGARLPTAVTDSVDRIEGAPDRPTEIAAVRPVVEVGNGRAGERSAEPAVDAPLGLAEGQGRPAGAEGVREPGSKPTALGSPPSSRPLRTGPVGPEQRTGAAPLVTATGGQPNGAGAPKAGAAAGSGAMLGDMTKQLEAALRRPQPPVEPPRPAASPAAPPPPRPRPPEPAPKAPAPPAREEPLIVRPSTAPPRPPAPAPPPRPAPPAATGPAPSPPPGPSPAGPGPVTPAPPSFPPPASAAAGPTPNPSPGAHAPAPSTTAQAGSAPGTSGPVAASKPSPAADAPPAAAPPAANPAIPPTPPKPDPFSIEDIEAEFARLLGRPLDPKKE